MVHFTKHFTGRTILILIAAACLSACDPSDRTPGTWLSGEEVTEPVSDWSFTDQHPEVWLQTSPWYGIPHSVTVVMAASGNELFVPSIYEEPAEFPGSKYWNSIIADDPEVLLKVGDSLYPRIARVAIDEAESDRGLAALAAKYPFWSEVLNKPAEERLPFVIIRLHDPE